MNGKNQLVAEVAKALEWTYEEAGNFMGHFVADNEDQLMADLEAACEWAREVEMKAAMIEVMKTMPARSMEARWLGKSIEVSLTPEKMEEE